MRRLTICCAVIVALVALAAAGFNPPAVMAGEAATSATDSDSGIVAYYFHGNKRCTTCRKLEAYSEEAITGGFASELESGELEWRVVNTDEKVNAHFVTDFELVTKSVVLVEYRDGEVVRFENLKLVWQLVGDQDGFLRYVRDETRDFLADG
jgi:hypothetical protein